MIFSFKPNQGLIIVQTKLAGPSGTALLRFALDTGATVTVVNVDMIISLGYDPTDSIDQIQVTTGSGIENAPRIRLGKITALGREQENFPILCHTLPPSAGIDGLLGLDFFRNLTLNIDFSKGQITVS